MHNNILLYLRILMYHAVCRLLLYFSFLVNPRLCAAISNLRNNKGG
jgi:hypothetical protein